MYAARWILAPICFGLIALVGLLAVSFVLKFVWLVAKLTTMNPSQIALAALQEIDVALLAYLVLIVAYTGWQGIIGPLAIERTPEFLRADFGTVKLRLTGTVVAFTAIALLETFIHIDRVAKQDALWQLMILLGLGVTGVLLAAMDRLSGPH